MLPNGSSSQDWASLKPPSQTSILSPTWMARVQAPVPSFDTFPGTIKDTVSEEEQLEQNQHFDMGPWHWKVASCCTTTHLFWKIYLFIWKSDWGRGKDRERGIFHPLVHSSNCCNSQGWFRLKAGARNLIYIDLPQGWQRRRYLSHCLLPSWAH